MRPPVDRLDDLLQFFVGEVGGDLHEEGLLPEGAVPLGQAVEERHDGLAPLEGPEPGGVGRGEVGDHEVRRPVQPVERVGVVVGGFVVARRGAAPDVDAERNGIRAPAERGEPAGDRVGPRRVEPEPVDQRLVLRETEQARPGVARLRVRRHGADLHEPEPEGRPRPQGPCRFVEAAGQPDGRREPDAAHHDGEARVVGRPAQARPERPGRSEHGEDRVVARLGFDPEEDRLDHGAVDHASSHSTKACVTGCGRSSADR